ncbi:alpha/beta hydrolase [Streptomyces sp. DSM 44915]|uniref:Alpha/beta hydrolase n=1 Tax=Streptomyces chisholmiae TaxID=3075540 RepID=A0ABU2JUE8_9ACTN|nr:alpha/beta hydrolase [Streptomyces sp. DSM 44915]MDT0268616.1 alpha/beta hydrolase [Streptomyces sp. DSM 44915]
MFPTRLGRTHLVSAGDEARADGAPRVLFVPGTNFNAATSLSLLAALAERWPTHVADVPGQPGLSGPERPRSQRLLAYGQWLGEVLDQLGPQPVVVLGHSLGGGIALACDSPRIAGRVLVSPAGVTRLRVTGGLLAATVPWLARPTEARSARLLRQMSGPGARPAAELVDWMTLLARSCRSSLAPAPLPGWALAGDGPTLVATGEHDVFLPPARLASAVERRLRTPVRILPGVGHLVAEERPETVVGLVESALNGRAGDGR